MTENTSPGLYQRYLQWFTSPGSGQNLVPDDCYRSPLLPTRRFGSVALAQFTAPQRMVFGEPIHVSAAIAWLLYEPERIGLRGFVTKPLFLDPHVVRSFDKGPLIGSMEDAEAAEQALTSEIDRLLPPFILGEVAPQNDFGAVLAGVVGHGGESDVLTEVFRDFMAWAASARS